MTLYRKYRDQVTIALVAIILTLLFILVTDIHVATINRRMRETIGQVN